MASILKALTTVLLLLFDTWPYAALPKEQLVIGLLNNINTFHNQSFRGALWNSFSKKSRNISRKMSAVEFRLKKVIMKVFRKTGLWHLTPIITGQTFCRAHANFSFWSSDVIIAFNSAGCKSVLVPFKQNGRSKYMTQKILPAFF